ncbi:hypothetical protein [Actinomadura rugatobispora]|uniref:Uncharacterized protein n=1 Tax=Actinomadura rugatobispora TaxID=1994 RepID=A0ABW1AAC4_9ACTN
MKTTVILTISAVLMAACGQDDPGQGRRRASHPVATPSASKGTPRGDVIVSNPQKRPSGLVEQLKLPVAGGGDPCPASGEFILWADYEDEFGVPGRREAGAPLSVQPPDREGICLGGVGPGRSAVVTVTDPSGKNIQKTDVAYGPDGTAQKAFLYFSPDNGPGTYTITARLDGKTTTRAVALKTPAAPKMLLLTQHPENTQIQRAEIDRLTFAFAGLPAQRSTPFYLYRGTDSTTLRFHSVHQVRGDAHGRGALDLFVNAQTPLGAYWMSLDPNRDSVTAALWYLA